MNWEQIKEISDFGYEIGSHSRSHPYLTKLSLSTQKKEIIDSKHTIESHIEKNIISFAYPFGNRNSQVINMVKDNYLFARTTTDGDHFHSYDLYNISTIHMTPKFSLDILDEIYGR